MAHAELVKSGCHALAILSDNRGEGAKIAGAGGVKVLLPVLRSHPKQVKSTFGVVGWEPGIH